MVPVWLFCAAVTFQWPGELQKTIQRVQDSQYSVAYQDIQVLKKAHTPASQALLFDLLSLPDEGTRIQAARALAELHRGLWQPVRSTDGATLADTMVDWLDRPEPTLRLTACDLLGQIGAVDQRERVAMMVTDADLDVRAACVRTLLDLYLGSEDLDPIGNLTVQLLSDPYFEVRKNAVTGLGMLGVKDSFVAFLPMLESDNADLRRLALQAVARIDPEKAMDYAIEALDDQDFEVKVAAIRALGTIGDARALPHLEPLLSQAMLDLHVVAALANIQDPEVGRLLLDLLQVNRLRNAALNALALHDRVAKDLVAEKLATTTEPKHVEGLLQVARLHPSVTYLSGLEHVLAVNPDRKMEVLDVLAGIEDREALLMALSFTLDPTPKIRARAIQVAGVILEATGQDDTVDEIIIDALCDQDPQVRLAALQLVERWRIPGGAKILVELMDSQYEQEAVGAAVSLLLVGESYPVPSLVQTLMEGGPHASRAASVLSEKKPERALEELVDSLDEEFMEEPGTGAGLVMDTLGFVMQSHTSVRAEDVVNRMLVHPSREIRLLGARAAVTSGRVAFSSRLSSMQAKAHRSARRVIAERLWHVQGHQGEEMIRTALADSDAEVRLLAVNSVQLSGAFPDDRRADLFVEMLSDSHEFVRINAAAALRAEVTSLSVHREHLCAIYDRPLTQMEMVSAMLLLADAGAPCLTHRLERLVHAPGHGPRSMVIEAVRLGVASGAVTLTEKMRAGLGQCAALPTYRHRHLCASLLEEDAPQGEFCNDWGKLTGAGHMPQSAPLIMGTGKLAPAPPLEIPAHLAPLPGAHVPELETAVSDGGPLFLVDGLLTIRVGVYDHGIVRSLPEPPCSSYRGFSVLLF